MWLTSSSIGRKFVMALTGACLVLFVTFHVLMNSVALLWPTAYNQICMFLGANWYALVASIGLAVLFIIHIIYAVWLTLQNEKARGHNAYAVTARPPQVEWSSKNMLVLGIVILAFLVVHLMQFWYKMQFQEIIDSTATVEGAPAAPEFGTLFLQAAFSEVWTPIVYIIGFIALWFHMNHGFWSMFHTVGWDSTIWIKRLKCIGFCWTTIVVLLFIAQAVLFTVQAHNKFFLTNDKLQAQYAEYYQEKAGEVVNEIKSELHALQEDLIQQPGMDNYRFQQALESFIIKNGPEYLKALDPIVKGVDAFCPEYPSEEIATAKAMASDIRNMLDAQMTSEPEPEPAPEAVEAVDIVEENLLNQTSSDSQEQNAE